MFNRWVVVLCCLVSSASSQVLSAGQGTGTSDVLANSCNVGNTCAGLNAVASAASNTILLPSINSVTNTAFQNNNLLTLRGNNLSNDPGLQVCLANVAPNGNCIAGGFNVNTCVTINAAGRTSNSFTINVPDSWRDPATGISEFETTPRFICFRDAAGSAFHTGLFAATTWACDDTVAAQTCATAYVAALNVAPYTSPAQANFFRSVLERRILQGNTVCCNSGLAFGVGQCINPKVQTCCGAAAVTRTTQRCCNAARQIVVGVDANCPCTNTDTANNIIVNGGCPTDERCCIKTKYPELIFLGQTTQIRVRQNGLCFDPQRQRCCDTGETYDPGAMQCCNINGVQSLNLPCPCETNDHCTGASTLGFNPIDNTNDRPNADRRLNGHVCCKQVAPTPNEVISCDAYNNFPTGTALPEIQRCSGVCIDTKYQMCCNGATCRREYEKCCNATCCNRRIGTCADYTYRAGTPGQAANWVDWNVRYTQCTTIEQLDPIHVFWIFILPTILGLGTLAALAVVLVFTSRARRRVFVFVEKLLIIFSLFVIIFAIVLFFSPAYKYGIVLALASLLAILTAAAGRVRWLNVLAVIFILVALWYLFDPVNGNGYLNSSYLRRPNFFPNEHTDGFWRTIDYFWQDGNRPNTEFNCVDWYNGYFQYDFQLRDIDRRDNPFSQTFGYCTRGYLAALMYFGIIAAALLVGMLMLALIMLVLRFRKEFYDVIELTTEVHEDGAMPFPGALDDDYFD